MVYETTRPAPFFLSEIFRKLNALFPFPKGCRGEMPLKRLVGRNSNHPNCQIHSKYLFSKTLFEKKSRNPLVLHVFSSQYPNCCDFMAYHNNSDIYNIFKEARKVRWLS